jgi:hypothetical protein
VFSPGHPGGFNPSRLVVRRDGRLLLLEGIAFESIEPATTVSDVPGSVFAMAFVRGQVVPVLCLGAERTHLLVGRVRGEVVALTGLEVIGFEPTCTGSELPEPFDVIECLETLKTKVHSGQKFE